MPTRHDLTSEERRRWKAIEVEAYILGMLDSMIDLAGANQLSDTIACVAACRALVAEVHKERVAEAAV